MCVSEWMRLVVLESWKACCWVRCAELDRNVERNDWSKESDELGVGVGARGRGGGGCVGGWMEGNHSR